MYFLLNELDIVQNIDLDMNELFSTLMKTYGLAI